MINVDQNPAYPMAIKSAKSSGYLPTETELRQIKYLNNQIECDHRRIKRHIKYGLGFKSFWTGHKTIRGFEMMCMFRKGQINLADNSHLGQVKFIERLFGVAA